MYENKNSWDKGVDFGVSAAKMVSKSKIVLWNMVRLAVCVPFICILLVECLSISAQGFNWPTGFWMVLSAWVIIRNIRKTIRETKRLVDPVLVQPPAGAGPSFMGSPASGAVIDADFKEIPMGEEPKKLQTKPVKYKVIHGPNGEEIRLPMR